MQPKDYLRSAALVVGGALIAYGATWATGGNAVEVIEELAIGFHWAVPLSLAVSIAMFNNMLRTYDRLEAVILDPKTEWDEVEAAQFGDLLQEPTSYRLDCLETSSKSLCRAWLSS
jgi:hypothetical protein